MVPEHVEESRLALQFDLYRLLVNITFMPSFHPYYETFRTIDFGGEHNACISFLEENSLPHFIRHILIANGLPSKVHA